ncbi:MAG: N-acetyltransferase [Sphingomonadaceae bacterium]|jgi:phosphinothricin acetyltransferase|nr:N-acetyltransferase [Sphingomonadaceae bacterium]
MTVAKVAIRSARIEDATAIAAIYAHHVLNGTASFDTVPRTVAETAERVGWITGQGWPFIVAEADGDVLGYAYATQFRDRPAYAATCENSIYLHPDWIGRGVGRMLLTELIDRARDCGFRQMIAVVGGGEPASVGLHEKLGFAHAGRMKSVGRKFGRWLDTVYMQLPLGGVS